MDYTETIQKIRERFEKRIEKDAYLAKVQRKIEEGTATMVDADIYAGQIAECYNIALREVLGKASIEEYREAVSSVIPKGFSQITYRVNDYTMLIIDQELQKAKIGMKAIPAAYDYQKERDVVDKIQQAVDKAEEVSQVEPETARQVESFSQKAATNTLQMNAIAQNDAGLEVRVTRIYDRVGVHMRKDPCEWCLERCGENMPYSEAYAKGAFERHPGCHCEIFYKPKRGSWQKQTDWKSNAWEDSQDPQILKMRKQYGVKAKTVPDFMRNARFKSGSMTAKEFAEYKRELAAYERYEQILLPRNEYAMIMRVFNSPEITDEERKHALITRAIRNKYYTVVNYGYDNYKLIDMWEIDPDFEEAYDD